VRVDAGAGREARAAEHVEAGGVVDLEVGGDDGAVGEGLIDALIGELVVGAVHQIVDKARRVADAWRAVATYSRTGRDCSIASARSLTRC
jgi:hypothetical protein